ncbi:MAG: 4-hydroxy-tetrahydrodipicolinate synthase [Thermoanaerobacteraceae bacterium]|nr:4-hydroxy-tetrahydrodipicolinate synthase [Thermoanaerobacteraceae bacterium]
MMGVRGVIPAMVTPFNRSGEIDEKAIKEYVEFLLGRGVHGLFPCGTNGEGLLLSVEERKWVAHIVVEQVAGRVPVVVHTGAINTRDTMELTKHAKDIGADAVGIVAPFYFPHDDESLEQHFRNVAFSVPDMPIYLYNIPGNAKNDLSPALVARLRRECPNIVGIKDSSKDLERLKEYIDVTDENFTVIVGTDSLFYPGLEVGAVGVVSAVANVFPEAVVQIYSYYRDGKFAEARAQQDYVNRLRDVLKRGPYITPYREALRLRGLDLGDPRPPLRLLSEAEREELYRGLRELGAV